MTIIIEAALIGILVGIVVGALGAGGGIIAVPVLVYLLGQDPMNAAASSLVIVGSSSLVSLIPHARRGAVDWRMGLIFAAASIAGNLAAARVSVRVPGELLMAGFAIMLIVVATLMGQRAVRAFRRPREADREAAAQVWSVRRVLVVLVVATGVGALTGFFGVGGGFAVVPALLVALHLPMRKAVGTSLLVLVFASLTGLAGRIGTEVDVDWGLTAAFAATSIVGALIGARFTRNVRSRVLTAAFAILLATVAIFTAVMTLPELLG